ncbi:hypothetical protein DFAR_3660006 [Desulfarculales bacterium]
MLTEAKVADVTVPQGLALNPGSILILNRGYQQDYALFGKGTGQGIFFVTRLKSNAVFEVMATQPGPKTQNVLADQTIFLTGSLTDCPYPLRRLVVWDEKNQKQAVLLTNHHELTASIVWLTSIRTAGSSSGASKRLNKILRSKPSWAPAATPWKFRF